MHRVVSYSMPTAFEGAVFFSRAWTGDAFANALFSNPGNNASWITLRLEGITANRFGIGARISVRVRSKASEHGAFPVRTIHITAGSGGSFGGSSMQQEIGLGNAKQIEEIIVRWPGSGTVQHFRDVSLNQAYSVLEGRDSLLPLDAPSFSLGVASGGE